MGASPDAITLDYVVEVKCPVSAESCLKYINSEGQITNRYKAQLMLQMLASDRKRGLFCVADPNFEKNKNFTSVWLDFDDSFITPLLVKATLFWRENIFYHLIKSIS